MALPQATAATYEVRFSQDNRGVAAPPPTGFVQILKRGTLSSVGEDSISSRIKGISPQQKLGNFTPLKAPSGRELARQRLREHARLWRLCKVGNSYSCRTQSLVGGIQNKC